jgi:hypothetical protein
MKDGVVMVNETLRHIGRQAHMLAGRPDMRGDSDLLIYKTDHMLFDIQPDGPGLQGDWAINSIFAPGKP